MERGHDGRLSTGLFGLSCIHKLILYGLLDAITEHDGDLVDLKVISWRLVYVRVVDINWISAGLHLKEIKWNHLLPIVAGTLVLKEPLFLVLGAVKQRINLEFLALDLVSDLHAMVEFALFRLLISYVNMEQLLGLGLYTEQICLL